MAVLVLESLCKKLDTRVTTLRPTPVKLGDGGITQRSQGLLEFPHQDHNFPSSRSWSPHHKRISRSNSLVQKMILILIRPLGPTLWIFFRSPHFTEEARHRIFLDDLLVASKQVEMVY